MSDNNNTDKKALEDGLESRSASAIAIPSVIWLYGLWISLAALSAILGQSTISKSSSLFLLGGIASTNFFFISIMRSDSNSVDFSRLLVMYQAIMGIAWTSAYFYYSTGSSDLVLGMYVTVLMFAVFYLDALTVLKLSCGIIGSYASIVALKIYSVATIAYPIDDSIRLLVLIAIACWCYVYARQLRELRYQLQFRNEELQSVVDKVTKIAEEDHLTKSYNRRYIMDALARERAYADRSDSSFAVLLFDIDHFKRINDRHGHLIGDQILTDFARRVKAELRGMDVLNATDHKRSFGRYGGEEFIAVLPDTDLLGAQHCAERIRRLIAQYSFRQMYKITVSVGVAEYLRGETVPQLLTRADQALYKAKGDGRNLVRCSERALEKTYDTVPKLRILK